MFDSGDNNVESSSGDASSFSQMEESLSDLKNTPSNIARLEDAVEQCKGRRKYLAQTRSPSDGDDVRWYFCKIPLGETGQIASLPLFFQYMKKSRKYVLVHHQLVNTHDSQLFCRTCCLLSSDRNSWKK